YLHDRRLHCADLLFDPGLDRTDRGAGHSVDRASGIDGDHRALWLDGGAHRLPAAAALVPPCADAVGNRHVVRADQLLPDRARRARQAGAADHPRWLQPVRERRLRGAAVQCADPRRHRHRRTARPLHLAGIADAAGGRPARPARGTDRARGRRDMRACEQDQTMAALLGVDVDRTISMTFVIGAALAAVAGMMYLLYY